MARFIVSMMVALSVCSVCLADAIDGPSERADSWEGPKDYEHDGYEPDREKPAPDKGPAEEELYEGRTPYSFDDDIEGESEYYGISDPSGE